MAADNHAPPVFVSSEAARSVFDWRETIDRVAEAYEAPASSSATPPRTVGTDEGAWLRTLPALPPGRRYFGAKLMGMATEATSPGAQYVIVLFDRSSSRIAAFVDGHDVTAYRTAATSAAALDRLTPREEPIRLAVLGSGLEAANHVRAFGAIRRIDQLTVFSPTPEHREAFAAAATTDLGVAAAASPSPELAVADADVVLAAARSRGERPILDASWLGRRVTIVSIGSTIPSQRELDTSVVDACELIVCDAVEEVLEQTGDMLAAQEAGVPLRDRTFSLHQLMSGELDARARASARSLFKSVGGGLQDIVVAELLLGKAITSGLATPLPIEFDSRR